MSKADDWERLRRLGEGGQSEVFLVRRPTRAEERTSSIRTIIEANPWKSLEAEPGDASGERTRGKVIDKFASALWQYVRPEEPSALAAMKCFKIRNENDREQPRRRLQTEITVLREGKPGLPKLLDANESEAWLVTEFFPHGTVEHHLQDYRGQPLKALKAFRSLVSTVAQLHKELVIHRDIKPANVFVGDNDKLILGDFGIVFLPEASDRVTLTQERVGPRDYMPQWGDLGERLEDVQPNFDVYMLGKLLWCMVAGRLKLPREYHRRSLHDLTVLFPGNPRMHSINHILDRCVVEHPEQCFSSAGALLALVEQEIDVAERGGQSLEPGVPRPCHVCGKGLYQPAMLKAAENKVAEFRLKLDWSDSDFAGVLITYPYACDACGHIELFRN